MGSAPEVPDGVLVQSVHVDDEGVEAGWRVWRDGRHESRRRGGPWADAGTIGAEGVAALRAVLDEAPLDEMAGVHRPQHPPLHGGALWFHVARPDGPATVVLEGGARSEPLERLTARLVPILAG